MNEVENGTKSPTLSGSTSRDHTQGSGHRLSYDKGHPFRSTSSPGCLEHMPSSPLDQSGSLSLEDCSLDSSNDSCSPGAVTESSEKHVKLPLSPLPPEGWMRMTESGCEWNEKNKRKYRKYCEKLNRRQAKANRKLEKEAQKIEEDDQKRTTKHNKSKERPSSDCKADVKDTVHAPLTFDIYTQTEYFGVHAATQVDADLNTSTTNTTNEIAEPLEGPTTGAHDGRVRGPEVEEAAGALCRDNARNAYMEVVSVFLRGELLPPKNLVELLTESCLPEDQLRRLVLWIYNAVVTEHSVCHASIPLGG